jgi:hypothetical protein
MKKIITIPFSVVGGLIITYYLVSLFIIGGLNGPANALFAGTPDKQCKIDADCTLKKTTCQPCDCGDAVNAKWKTFCPFPTFARYQCEMCASPQRDFNISCIEDRCERIWRQ